MFCVAYTSLTRPSEEQHTTPPPTILSLLSTLPSLASHLKNTHRSHKQKTINLTVDSPTKANKQYEKRMKIILILILVQFIATVQHNTNSNTIAIKRICFIFSSPNNNNIACSQVNNSSLLSSCLSLALLCKSNNRMSDISSLWLFMSLFQSTSVVLYKNKNIQNGDHSHVQFKLFVYMGTILRLPRIDETIELSRIHALWLALPYIGRTLCRPGTVLEIQMTSAESEGLWKSMGSTTFIDRRRSPSWWFRWCVSKNRCCNDFLRGEGFFRGSTIFIDRRLLITIFLSKLL